MRLIKSLLLATVLVVTLSAREQVNVNFAGLQIKDFIKLISKITHKNILLNHKINGTVDFVSATPVYDDELINILISVLESKGFTLLKDGSMYEIIRSTDAAKHNARVVSAGKKVSGSLMTTHSIKIEDENVDVVAAKIRYLISKTAKLMTMKETNTILITDYPRNIETIKRVIGEINSKRGMVVNVIPIKHTEIKKLQTRLVDIAKSIFNEKIISQKVKIVIDENIHSLIVIGDKENVKTIEDLIKKLDKESTVTNGVQIFHLKNSDAKGVLASLNAIISKQKFKDPAMKPNISSSEEINAIIAIGEPNVIKGIKMIIDELDKEKYQVYVKARIVEISNNKVKELGVKYGFGGGAGTSSANGLYAMSANVGTMGDSALALGLAAEKSFALLGTLNFLETKGASKSVSNPSILCINNQQSSIYVGKTISVQTASTIGTTGLPTASYKREDIGLTLKIKPRVSSSDKVGLDVEISLENLQASDSAGNPVTTKQEVKTQIILRSGEDILIGGLVRNYTFKTVEKVPLLGDIPWLGDWLFTYKKDDKVKDNLLVVLTPYVIEKSENLSTLQQELGDLANLQAKYNLEVIDKMEKRVLEIEEDSIEE